MLRVVGNMKLILEMQIPYLSAGSTVAMLHVKKSLLVESQVIDVLMEGVSLLLFTSALSLLFLCSASAWSEPTILVCLSVHLEDRKILL